ncbi:Rv2231c family pyridoxal phosphate-dependent protein CobC [Amycolatopsis acidiphila]|uniref:Aminotransferase n=1 Tax=Amycolatopsis acidiphila TaxID=715473 RepID=A0A558AHA5_9PSEU|nr:Rv2231c family pyridoxal phosphate-dependent protein CobC [Amycolatopsis acidiphila]TVT23655.1 threonine-phosphate decarboxylase [Amycolatopsis acidiphila]UIJ58647.1 Rv2231c family pyridoxal phosphate-dependent protein CobC [Amycolatopsis acidiphila]GHG76260.1 aminotransferase [Amycolatopsis acidiphila]
MSDYDLHHHGDREVGAGLIDLAVNVRLPEPPEWLRRELAESLAELAAYPDATEATEAVAARHGRQPGEVLVTAGAAEAFTLLATAFRGRDAVVVHPQFTEPEAALRAAGHEPRRVVLQPDYVLDPSLVPDDADLVFVGNPTNPTSVLHPAATLEALLRPGRVLVVDEAFLDAVPGEPESLAGKALPGLVVIRSLTKTWGIAGLRAGYLLAEPGIVRRLQAVQPPWSVSTPAARAVVACCRPAALDEADKLAVLAERDRERLVAGLRELGVAVPGTPRAPFVLVKIPGAQRLRLRLREAGYAVRRGDTFPGLDGDHLRLAVRDEATTTGFLRTLASLLPG